MVDELSDLTDNLIIGGLIASGAIGFGMGICTTNEIPMEYAPYVVYSSASILGMSGLVQSVSAIRDMFDYSKQRGEDTSKRNKLKEGALMTLGMFGMVEAPGYIIGLGLGTVAGGLIRGCRYCF